MRAFVLHPTVAELIARVERFTPDGPGALPSLSETPPAGLDVENAALYQEVRRTIAAIQRNVDYWRTQASYEGQAAAQAQQTMSTP
jgi:hypothetical protein